MTCLFGVLLVYSQTLAFAWDEGFHMLAAQLIARGKRLYLDFCFPQPPLNALWIAGWMRVLGESWRAVHALAATVTAGMVLLSADYFYRRFPDVSWRFPGAVAVALLIGLNVLVIQYATLGQPYALCLFLLVAAFRAAVIAAEREGWLPAMATGLLASAAAASSLLAGAAVPVFLLWIVTRRGWRKCFAFVSGAAIPFLPVFWWFAEAPRTVLFNLVQYQLFYRRANWEDAGSHDWQILTSWLTSPQALVLGALAVAGIWFASAKSKELYLCGWLAVGIGAELCAAHPSFEWYFVLIVPFLAIPAAAGLCAICAHWFPRIRPWWAVAGLCAVLSIGTVPSLSQTGMRWRDLEAVARKVDEVTPRSDALWADEHIYFLTGRQPAEGTEFAYVEIANVPDGLARFLHVVSLDELDLRAAAGMFATVSTCEEKEQIEALELPRIFLHQASVGTCHVFWGPAARGIR